MKILSIDTASNLCTVAILEDKSCIKEIIVNDARNHSEKIMPVIEQTLQEAGLTLHDIDLIVCDKGPAEQAVNWDWMMDKIKKANRDIKVLNLFAYTGGATVACAAAGASVCHVDSSKGMVTWAKDNIAASGLAERPVRYIVDDVVKFVNREIRRGNKYDAIIMDPPSYGRGANGEVWQFEDNIYDLVELCTKVLSDKPLFFLINSYTTGISSKVLENILNLTVSKNYKGKVSSGEVGLPMENSNLVLPCGIFGRWES